MSLTFTKLFSCITDSTVWNLDPSAKVVWITLLAMSDRHGQVFASIPGLAHRARVSIGDTVQALEIFRSPDEWSRTKDNEGRRLEDVEGGWRLLNYTKYRALQDAETIKESKRRWASESRAKSKDVEKVEVSRELSSASASSYLDQDQGGAGGQPAVWFTLEGFKPSPALLSEAAMLGLDESSFAARLAELGNGPIGGRRGVLDREKYVRSQLGKWRTWAETARAGVFKAGKPQGPIWEPNARHRAFWAQRTPTLELLASAFRKSGYPDANSSKDSDRNFGARLKRLADGQEDPILGRP